MRDAIKTEIKISGAGRIWVHFIGKDWLSLQRGYVLQEDCLFLLFDHRPDLLCRVRFLWLVEKKGGVGNLPYQ